MTIAQLSQNEYDSYYNQYIENIDATLELLEAFKIGQNHVIAFFGSIPLKKWDYRYEPGKWSIKEILQHLIDTERIFMYRCFRIARRDKTNLAGFEQDHFINPSNAVHKTYEKLLQEYKSTRAASIVLLDSLSDEDLAFVGMANSTHMSARAVAFTVLGHEIWHMGIIKERYLVD